MTFDPKGNYCSMSPDFVFGVDTRYSCYLHDRQYRNEVKKRLKRKKADLLLRDEIYNRNGKTFKAFLVSRFYYYAVRLFAVRSWA